MATCQDCFSNNPLIFDVQAFVNASCSDCTQQNCLPVKYLCYTGPDLDCSGILTGDTLEVALQKLDTQVCSALGDYSTYQFNCLSAWLGTAITTEAEFVDAITAYACEIAANLLTVTTVTIPDLEITVTNMVIAVSEPAITCVAAGVTDTDNLNTILAKYCTKLGTLTSDISLSGVVWNSCFASSTPTTIADAFTLVETQICAVKTIADAAAVLPTFNNSTNCLAGTVSDTLVETIDALTAYACSCSPFDADDVSWVCIDATGVTNLQEAFQLVVTTISANQQLLITAVSADFVLSLTNALDPCDGLTLELATPLVNNDRLVASNVADLTPGTLIQKLTAGTNITLDDTTTPGQVIINASDDHLLLAGAGDITPGLLIDKVAGDTDNGITLTPVFNGTTDIVNFELTVDMETLAGNMLTYITASPTLLAQFCAMVALCGEGCASTLYSVENTSGTDQDIFWLTCGSSTYLHITVPTATTVDICALTDSILPIVGVTVTDIGPCPVVEPPTTTTTTTTTTAAP